MRRRLAQLRGDSAGHRAGHCGNVASHSLRGTRMRRGFVLVCSILWVLFVGIRSTEAAPIVLTNGDFETGTLAGWTTFVTPIGSLGPAPLPDVTSFDVDGDASSSNSARFQVGQATFTPDVQAGGGIFQSFTSGAGTLSLSADIATFDSEQNGAAGAFSLLLDGVVVDTFDFGFVVGGVAERTTLDATVAVAAGAHEIRFLITRAFNHSLFGDTPFHFIDDVTLDLESVSQVPEPATMILLAFGLAGVGARRWRQRRTA